MHKTYPSSLLYPDALRLITGRQNWYGMRCLHGFWRRLAHATLIDPWVPFTVDRSPQRLLYNRASTGVLRGSCRSTSRVDMALARIDMRAPKSLLPASDSHRAYPPFVNHTLYAARCSTPPTVPLWSNYTLNPPSLVILPPVLFRAQPAPLLRRSSTAAVAVLSWITSL
jgi:hypothetical protein